MYTGYRPINVGMKFWIRSNTTWVILMPIDLIDSDLEKQGRGYIKKIHIQVEYNKDIIVLDRVHKYKTNGSQQRFHI